MPLRQLAKPGRGQPPKLLLFRRIHRHLSREQIAGRARLHLKDHERVAIPSHQVEVALHPCRHPPPLDDRIAERSQVKKSLILAPFSCQQVFRLRTLPLAPRPCSQPPIGQCAKSEIKIAFEAKEGARGLHEVSITAENTLETNSLVVGPQWTLPCVSQEVPHRWAGVPLH